MISIKKYVTTTSTNFTGIKAEDELFLDCICEMMENVEKKARFTNDMEELSQLNDHRFVIRRVLEENLNLN